jgi:hypothetical protein
MTEYGHTTFLTASPISMNREGYGGPSSKVMTRTSKELGLFIHSGVSNTEGGTLSVNGSHQWTSGNHSTANDLEGVYNFCLRNESCLLYW